MSQQGLSTRQIGKLLILGCGGGGINIAREYLNPGHSSDIAEIEVGFIDTSDSNLTDSLKERAWLFDGLDGSGKIRSANDKAMAKAVPDILRKFKPADLTVVVFTASGGTGNVIGALLLKQLLEQGHQAVGIVTGSYESIKTAENTIGTIKTLDAIARGTDKPVVIHFGMNRPDVPRSTVDREAHLMINALAVLCSRRNHGLDTADIKSFLQFNGASTDVPACLARIHLFDSIPEFEKALTDPISAAYLKRDQDDPQPSVFVPYSCDGFMPSYAQASSSLFFGIENHSFGELRQELEALKREMELQRKTRAQAVTFFGDEDETSDTGLVL